MGGSFPTLFEDSNLSDLPTSDPGNGQPWNNGGLLSVGSIPTSDPYVAGVIWNDNGVLSVSRGLPFTAVTFDGVGDYASKASLLSLFSGAFTYEFVLNRFVWANSKYLFNVDNNAFSISTNTTGNLLRIGPSAWSCRFDIGNTEAPYLGKWRVVYDPTKLAFDRVKLYHNEVEVARFDTGGTFANLAFTSGTIELAARTASGLYTDCTLSAAKFWPSAVYQGDSEASPAFSLDAVTGSQWKDNSGNSRHFSLFADATGTAISETISLSLQNNQILQRSGLATTTLPVTVSYTGSPVSIEARHSGGDWQTIKTSPATGPKSFTWNLTVSGSPGDVEVRFGNRTAVTAKASNVMLGILIATAGDSVDEGRCTVPQVYSGSQPAYAYRPGASWVVANDPVDTGTNVGSQWPLLLTLLADEYNCPVGIVPCGTGSQDISGDAPNRNAYAPGNASYNTTVSQMREAGGKFEFAIIMFGRNAGGWSGNDQATYKAAIIAFVNALRADVQADMVIYWDLFGQCLDRSINDGIRQAVIECYNSGLIKPGPNLLDQVYTTDQVHPKTPLYMAQIAARCLLAKHDKRGPVVSSIEMPIGGTVATLTYDQDLEPNDSTYTASAFGFKDNGVDKTILSVTRSGSRTVSVTLSSPISSSSVLATFGKDPTFVGATMPRAVLTPLSRTQNGLSSDAQPAEPFIDKPVTVI